MLQWKGGGVYIQTFTKRVFEMIYGFGTFLCNCSGELRI